MISASKKNQVLCIIPARGGSKRIPRKNIKSFCGKPMIQRSIEAAFEAGCFSQIVVSTDDPEIAKLSLELNVLAPFKRPAELADDYTDTRSVIRHAIDNMRTQDASLDHSDLPVCCLYATAPLVDAASIRGGLELLNDCDFVIPVTSYPHPVQRALRCSKSGKLDMLNPDKYSTRSQDLDHAWHDVGQFYWGRAAAWHSSVQPYEMYTRAIKIPRWRAQDIDTLEDWEHAEALFNVRTLSKMS
ncbi:pseudaminic acid cytidylyltransferase [Granulosicoccus sp.]|nr:pseudaminic acid cytidylyltransferase [Granulosicoccus sp.]